jgi:hypothetical protein
MFTKRLEGKSVFGFRILSTYVFGGGDFKMPTRFSISDVVFVFWIPQIISDDAPWIFKSQKIAGRLF